MFATYKPYGRYFTREFFSIFCYYLKIGKMETVETHFEDDILRRYRSPPRLCLMHSVAEPKSGSINYNSWFL